MNNKGFTLIELLITIVILGILITIATTSVLSITARVNDRAYDLLVSEIKSAAENYAVDSNKRAFFIQELIQEGYIESDDEDGYLYSPKEKSVAMNCFPVEVEFINGAYISNIIEESYEMANKTCDDNKLINSELNFSIKATKVSGTTYELTVDCPLGYYLIVSSNNGYYKTVANTTSNKYTYTVTVSTNIKTTYTATLKKSNENIIKTRSVTI